MLLYYKISFLSGTAVALILLSFIYFRSKKDMVDKIFSLTLLSSAVWSFGFFMTMSVGSLEEALFWRRLMDSGAALIPAFWMHFVYSMLNLKDKGILIKCYLASLTLLVLNIADSWVPGLFVSGMSKKDIFTFYVNAGFGYYLFLLSFWLIVSYSIFLLIREYRHSSGLKAQQIKYIIFASLLGFSGGGMSFLLSFNIPVPPYGIIFFAFYPIVIFYAITKYHLLDIKVITTELLTFSIWFFLLVRLFVNPTFGSVLANSILLAVIVIFGISLIKSVLNEVGERENLEKLSANLKDLRGNLENKIVEQSEKVKKAYEIEKKARLELEELDKDKDKFILATQHHLRTPITIIKGYLNSLRGAVDNNSEVGGIFSSMNGEAENISKSVNDLLRATEIKVNKKNGT